LDDHKKEILYPQIQGVTKAQKDAEDKSCQIVLGNLHSEVITLRNEALEKDKILLSVVEKLNSSEARLTAQVEAHEAEV
jgi:hypothetical protein